MLTPDTPIEKIPKINPKHLPELKKLGIFSVQDLLFYFPYRYEDFSNTVQIAEISAGENISIKATVKSIRAFPGFRHHANRAEAVVEDGTGELKTVWFNQSYLANTFQSGDEIFLAGTVKIYKEKFQLFNPIYEKMNYSGKEQIHTGRILPVYRLAAKIPLRSLRTYIFAALEAVKDVPETLPKDLLDDVDLMGISETITNLHFPREQALLNDAKNRKAFDEILVVHTAVKRHKMQIERQKGLPIPFQQEVIKSFVSKLPFELTQDQRKSIWDILQDIEKDVPMNRLLEGDVGSGKTLVALTAALEVLQEGLQVSLLCPTEILAQQHYASALKFFDEYKNITVILLTSKGCKIQGKEATKKEVLDEISIGGSQMVVSTHAALQENVVFRELALLIIDEQHRFGVRQRAALAKNKDKMSFSPHLLSMSATPIPRSLKLTLFGDLSISQLKRLPKGRKPIITQFVPPDARQIAYDFIVKQIKNGRQVFVVTPLVEESDKLGVKAATSEHKNLAKLFPELAVGLLHGKMKAPQKEKAMQEFLANKTQILVSTSVIEVGVDVPNASVMVIEGAERFGLAQLHQFRGRVGRAEHQSHCLLFSDNLSAKSKERLDKFCQITDGFELAELDLEMRGFGNIFGEEQSGFYYFYYFSFIDHKELSNKAAEWADKILSADPELKTVPVLKKSVESRVIHLE